MIRTDEKEIDGSFYMVTQLPARKALRLKAKLLKIFGAPLAQLVLPDEGKKLNIEVNPDGTAFLDIAKVDAVKALPLLFANLDEKSYESLVMELLQGVRKGGMELTESVVDSEFAGELSTLMKVLWFVIEVNFGSFWKEGDTGSPSTQGNRSHNQMSDMRKTSMKT